MSLAAQRLLKTLGLLIAVTVLAFGLHTAAAANSPSLCNPGQPGYLGECPPLTAGECNTECKATYGTWSMGNECAGGCCICAQK
jgi:hypothetical protein